MNNLLRIASYFFIFIVTATLGYFWVLKKSINDNVNTRHHYHQSVQALSQKKRLKKQEMATSKSLATWQHNHPRFFNVMSTLPNKNTILEKITELAEQAGFQVGHFSPLQKQVQDKKTKTDSRVQLELNGHFANLFLLARALNHYPFPISIHSLTILHGTQFELTLTLRGLHA